MSIASEITRLQGVKSDILTAIADKGVTVPADSMLDDCPDLIASISSGGGDLPEGYKRAAFVEYFSASTGVITTNLIKVNTDDIISFVLTTPIISNPNNDIYILTASNDYFLSRFLNHYGDFGLITQNNGGNVIFDLSKNDENFLNVDIYIDKVILNGVSKNFTRQAYIEINSVFSCTGNVDNVGTKLYEIYVKDGERNFKHKIVFCYDENNTPCSYDIVEKIKTPITQTAIFRLGPIIE